jgi:WD40 repeat protein
MADVSSFFQVGSTLPADSPSYVERPADAQLLDALILGELCLVLAPRQTGKSSLMVHALQSLAERDICSGIVDLQRLGEEVNPDRFFNSVMSQLRRSLGLKVDVYEWSKSHERLSPTERFAIFIEEVVLVQCEGDVVLFFDEVDSILKLRFSDDFFTTIRSLHNGRATDPELRRLRFVLLGTTTKSAFVKNRSRTPFNVGTEITLTDFDPADTTSFKRVLGDASGQIIDRIFHWTSGQPLLVQKLAAAAYSWPPEERTPSRLDREVDSSILKQRVEQDTHLKFIRDYLLGDRSLLHKTLLIYSTVLDGQEVAERNQSPGQDRLKLAGVVRTEGGHLRTRNRIYSIIFNRQWVEENTPFSFADWPFKYQAVVVSVPLLLLIVLGFLLRPYFYPRMPDMKKEMYYESAVDDLEFDAGDATRASLTPGVATIEDKHLKLHLGNLLPGEWKYKLTVEGDCLFQRMCFGEEHREMEFTLFYYRGGQVRQFPDPAVETKNVIQSPSGVHGVYAPVAFSANGQLLASSDNDSAVKVWDTTTGELKRTLEVDGTRVGDAVFTSNNRTLIDSRTPVDGQNLSGVQGGTIRLWDVGSGTVLDAAEIDGDISHLTFHPGRVIAKPSPTEPVTPNSLEPPPPNSLEPVTVIEPLVAVTVNSYKVKEDGKLSETECEKARVDLMEVDLPKEVDANNALTSSSSGIQDMSGAPRLKRFQLLRSVPFPACVNALAFSRDDKDLAAAALANGTIELFNVITGESQGKISVNVTGPVYAVGFSPDGKRLASASVYSELIIWDVATKGRVTSLPGVHKERVTSVAFSPDGDTLVTGSFDKTVRLWDIERSEVFRTFKRHDDKVMAVAFSPDNNLVASSSEDHTVRLWWARRPDAEERQSIKLQQQQRNAIRGETVHRSG